MKGTANEFEFSQLTLCQPIQAKGRFFTERLRIEKDLISTNEVTFSTKRLIWPLRKPLKKSLPSFRRESIWSQLLLPDVGLLQDQRL